MSKALWTVQILLAAAFGMAGFSKAFTPLPELTAQMAWVADVPAWMPRLAGFAELAAALGLILPAVTRIKPGLTPLAAAGLVAVMALALGIHIPRGEAPMIITNLVLASLAGFVAYGRWKLAPIAAREGGNMHPAEA